MRSLALLVMLFAPAAARAADFDPNPVDAVVEKAMAAFRVPGAAVVIVQDDRVVYLKGFGVRELGKSEKVTPDTVFAIASCTKAFAATLVAMLVDEGKLKWDDKVRDHLEWYRLTDEPADREVTVRDLLCHRTGMPRHDFLWLGQAGDPATLIRQWTRAKPSTSFRSTWEYSNVPFTTAGLIAEKVEKTDWAAATAKRIFEPLGMGSTSCTAREAIATADHATPHYLGFDKGITAIAWDNLDSARAAGSICSTARDLGNWLRFQLAGGKLGDKRLLAEKVLRETHTPQMVVRQEGRWAVTFPPKATSLLTYGLGWFVHDHRGHACVSHGGTLTGFRAQCMLCPGKKVGVFVVGNLRPSGFTEAVAKAALDHLLGLPADDWTKYHTDAQDKDEAAVATTFKKREADRKPDTKPSLPPKGYAGGYDEPAYGRATVAVGDDRLTLKWGKFLFRLEHYHFDTFTAVPIEPKDELVSFDRGAIDVQFRLGKDGTVDGLTFLDQDFKRKK